MTVTQNFLNEISGPRSNNELLHDAFIVLSIERMTDDDLLELQQEIKKLIHHKDTTIGLWATDRPDLLVDNKKVLFEIKY